MKKPQYLRDVTPMPQLSIILVSYNVSQQLAQCLVSIEKASVGMEVEVILIDNASVDDTVSVVKAQFPAIQLIKNWENVGFAKACNQGLACAAAQFVLFLNPDTLLPEDALKKTRDFMQSHPDAGALGVRMVNAAGRYLPESKRGYPTIRASFGKMLGLYRLFPHSRFFSAYYMGHLAEDETNEVEVLSGAFLMMPTDLAKQLGGFDERFFMYAEDIDLSYRIHQAGYKNYYYPSVTITHLKGASTDYKQANYTKRFYGAMTQYIDKHYADKPIKRMVLKLFVLLAKGLAHVKRVILLTAR